MSMLPILERVRQKTVKDLKDHNSQVAYDNAYRKGWEACEKYHKDMHRLWVLSGIIVFTVSAIAIFTATEYG